MRLFVRTSKTTLDEFQDVWRYQTNNGELDLMTDEGVVFKTYAAGYWLDVERLKEEDEDWPSELFETQETEEDETGFSISIPGVT